MPFDPPPDRDGARAYHYCDCVCIVIVSAIVSARADEVDRVKPFSLEELAGLLPRSRCGAPTGLARRRRATGTTTSRSSSTATWCATRGEEIRLTPKEFELFRYLVDRVGRVLTRERLLERVWGYESDVETRSIDARVRRLRLKLGPARRHIETIVGIGYRFVK